MAMLMLLVMLVSMLVRMQVLMLMPMLMRRSVYFHADYVILATHRCHSLRTATPAEQGDYSSFFRFSAM